MKKAPSFGEGADAPIGRDANPGRRIDGDELEILREKSGVKGRVSTRMTNPRPGTMVAQGTGVLA